MDQKSVLECEWTIKETRVSEPRKFHYEETAWNGERPK